VNSPLTPTLSGKAAFSLKNLLGFQKPYSHAGVLPAFFWLLTSLRPVGAR
jgi:hypothetical protein